MKFLLRLLLGAALAWGGGVVAWAQTGPVADSLVFVINNTPVFQEFDATNLPTFVRDVDNVVFQFTFRNADQVDLALNISVEITPTGNEQSTPIINTTCRKTGGPQLDEEPQACAGLPVPGTTGGDVESVVQVSFFTGDLPATGTTTTAFNLLVLIQFGSASQQLVDPFGTQDRLGFNLAPPPPSVSIEGPVTLEPELPRQGDIVTVSFVVANNKATAVPFRLTFELKQLGSPEFLPLDFLRVNANCARCLLSGTLLGNERKRVEFRFTSASLPPTFDPLEATNVSVAQPATTNGTSGTNGTHTVAGTVEVVTVVEGEVFVLLNQGSEGRIWLKVVGPVTDQASGAAIAPQDIRAGMALTAFVVQSPVFAPAPVGRFDPAEVLINPYLVRITANPEQNNTINQIVVGFNLRQPIRQLALRAPSSLPTIALGGPVRLDFSVTNESGLFLSGNFATAELVRLDADAPQAIHAASCRLRPLSGALLGLVQACANAPVEGAAPVLVPLVFDLAPFQATDFQFALDSQELAPGRYQINLAVGPSGVSQQTASQLGLKLQASVSFRLEQGVGGNGQTQGPARGPELRPIELKIVPGATVEQGTRALLSTKVKNVGNQEAKGVVVRFFIAAEGGVLGTLIAEHVFSRLGAGLELSVDQVLDTTALAPGRYRIRVEVSLNDPEAVELDPQNNTLEGSITIVAPPKDA